jgi:hypothetical protein
MRFLSVLGVAVLSCQIAHGQPTSKELIASFRKTIGGETTSKSVPYLIQYRGERHLYSLRDGKLLGESYPFNAKLYGYTDKHNKHRKEIEMKIGIVPFKMVEVIDGHTGWYQMNEGDAVPMSKRELDGREQREIHVEVFLGRESFDPGRWQFSDPESTQVRGQDAWKFEARAKETEPLTLYFAKDSGLLIRLTSKASDFAWLPGANPKVESFTRDLYFGNWKKLGNRMFPGSLEAFHDGVLWQQMEPVSLSLTETINPQLFAAPPRKE